MKKSYIQSISIASLLGFAFLPVKSLAEDSPRGYNVSLGLIGGLTGVREDSSGTFQLTGVTSGRKFSPGIGFLIEAPLNDFIGIDTGALYVARKFELGNNAVKLTRTVPTLIIPLEARLWIGHLVSVSGGAFVAVRSGDASDEVTSGSTSLGTFSSGSSRSTEFGGTLACSFNLPVIEKTGLFAELRYNHGLTNTSEVAVFEERMDDLLLMIGVRI